MIRAKHRFHGRGSLDYVYRRGRLVRGGELSIKFVDSRAQDYRLAVVVSKKVSKSAVTRNRIRRRIYEYFRNYRKEQGKPIPFDLVITAHSDALAHIDASKLGTLIEELIRKTKI